MLRIMSKLLVRASPQPACSRTCPCLSPSPAQCVRSTGQAQASPLRAVRSLDGALGTATRHIATNAAAPEAYAEEEYGVGEVEWNPQLANAVSLVGHLGGALEVRQAGRSQVANCSLAVRAGRDKPSTWYDVELWGGLATAAAKELKKGELVQVLGKLKTQEWTSRDGVRQKSVRVNASQIHRIRFGGVQNEQQEWESAAPSQLTADDPSFDDQSAGLPGWGSNAQPLHREGKNAEQWQHLISNIHEYYDNRASKTNPKAPDFKHKQTRAALWLNSAPEWARDEISRVAAPP